MESLTATGAGRARELTDEEVVGRVRAGETADSPTSNRPTPCAPRPRQCSQKASATLPGQ
jgi:hypothetical protein